MAHRQREHTAAKARESSGQISCKGRSGSLRCSRNTWSTQGIAIQNQDGSADSSLIKKGSVERANRNSKTLTNVLSSSPSGSRLHNSKVVVRQTFASEGTNVSSFSFPKNVWGQSTLTELSHGPECQGPRVHAIAVCISPRRDRVERAQ